MPMAADGAAAFDADGNVLLSGRLELDTVPALEDQGPALF